MMNNEIIQELDRTSATTGLKNFFSRKKNAVQSALGSRDAVGRQDTRQVADKLYNNWRTYIGQQDKQGNADDLGQFIYQNFGGDPIVMRKLEQQFPDVFQPQDDQQEQTDQQQSAQDEQNQQEPAQDDQQEQTPISDQDSMSRLQSYMKRINGLLRRSSPDQTKVMRAVNSMFRSFADPRRSDKARTWVRKYFDRDVASYAEIVPELGQFGDDPFAKFVNTRRSTSFASPSDDITIPPRPGITEPPEFLRRQKIDKLSIPPSPSSARPTQPPEFLRRQKNQPSSSGKTIWRSKDHDYPVTPTGKEMPYEKTGQIYAQVRYNDGLKWVPKNELVTEKRRPIGRLIEADGLQRAQVDAIFVALARILLDTGAARIKDRVRPPGYKPPQDAAQQNTEQQQGQQSTGRRSVMTTRITPDALRTVINKVQLSESEAAQLQQIVANQPLSLADILKTHVTLSNSMMAALVYAAETIG